MSVAIMIINGANPCQPPRHKKHDCLKKVFCGLTRPTAPGSFSSFSRAGFRTLCDRLQQTRQAETLVAST
jgi:hypothetical protein